MDKSVRPYRGFFPSLRMNSLLCPAALPLTLTSLRLIPYTSNNGRIAPAGCGADISGVDIRQSYPFWDQLVEGVRKDAAYEGHGSVDAEIYCVNLLTSSIIGPRVFRNSVAPAEDNETIVRRFGDERRRVLRLSSLLRE